MYFAKKNIQKYNGVIVSVSVSRKLHIPNYDGTPTNSKISQ